jgi:hypothetical protein
MAFKHGKSFAFLLGTDDLSAFCDGIEWNRSREVGETTTAGAAEDTKTYVAGLRDNSFSISGKYDSTATTGPRAVLNAAIDSDNATVAKIRPEGTGTTLPENEVSCFCTGYAESIPVADVITFTAEFQCTGVVDETAQA